MKNNHEEWIEIKPSVPFLDENPTYYYTYGLPLFILNFDFEEWKNFGKVSKNKEEDDAV